MPRPLPSALLHSVLLHFALLHFALAAPSRPATMSVSLVAGGGILPSSRRQRRQLVVEYRCPTVQFGAYVAVWRCSPVFPLTISAEVSPSLPYPSVSCSVRFGVLGTLAVQYPERSASSAPSRLNLSFLDVSAIHSRAVLIRSLPHPRFALRFRFRLSTLDYGLSTAS